MEKGRSYKRDRILQLTLEIIYLLTGEDYGPVKEPGGHMQSRNCLRVQGGRSRTQSPIISPPPPSLRPDRNNDRKILEVTKKIIELLTGEVPIRCQDVTVYFSMEEWEYLEGHKDLYKDVMMEDQQIFHSPGELHDHEVTEEVHLTVVKEEHLCTEGRLSHSDLPSPTEPTPNDIKKGPLSLPTHQTQRSSTQNKKEPLSSEEDPPRPLVSFPTHHTQHGSTHIKNESLSTEEPKLEVFTPNHHTQPPPAHTEMPLSAEEHLPHSDCSARQKVSTDHTDPSSGSSQHLAEKSLTAKIQSDDKPYGCCGCGKSFETNAELIKHRKIHTGQKPYSCSDCGKCFLYNSQLVTHQRIHTGERPFACNVCGKSFIKNAHLVTHQRSHTGEKPFSCPECGKCFVTNAVLRAHLRVHSGDKPFYCAECGKCFVSKSRLTKHRKYHSREKPFSCSECGKAFLKNSDLTRHLRIHTGERPYCCSDCGKRFIQRSNLLLHQRTHTGLRPYSCGQCGRGFHCKTSLVKHESNHTEKQLPSPNTAPSSGAPVPVLTKK